MIFRQLSEENKKLVFELYYLYHIRFAGLEDFQPQKMIQGNKRDQNRAVKQMMFAKSRDTGRII